MFRGLRYGESTAGAQRFLAPLPVRPWSGVRDALTAGHSAPQIPRPAAPLTSWYFDVQSCNEDCLFLDLVTPATDAARRPVMVWLHGGGWAQCAGTAPGFDATALARDGDVVVVCPNHRLNVFGHLDLGAEDERFADSANAGVLDLLEVLRWVHDNIAAFGGDPDNVTIFGQSGGAAKVTALLALPAARGLFHKAAVQSCSGGMRLCPREDAQAQAHALAAGLGLARPDPQALQALPMESVLKAMAGMNSVSRPVLDGRHFFEHPFDGVALPAISDIPLLIGTAADEMTFFLAGDRRNFFLDEARVLARLTRLLAIEPGPTKLLYAAYQDVLADPSPSQVLIAATTDYVYRRNTTRIARLKAAQRGAPVHAYRFDWHARGMEGLLGATHTAEVPFIFGTTDRAAALLGAGDDLQVLTRQMIARWSAFARTGSPQAEGLAYWPAHEAAAYDAMLLDVDSRAASDPDRQRLALLEDLPYFEYGMPANALLRG